MFTKERLDLVAPCGIDCGICELYACRDNPKLLEILVSRGMPKEKLPCNGCRSVAGNCPVIGGTCETFTCAGGKGAAFCHQCADFPCEKLNPSADRAAILPHNTKVFNLCTIKRDGIEGFVEKSMLIKRKYYEGKMEIGRGPILKG